METKRERVRASAVEAMRKRTRKEKVCASAAEAMRGCERTMETRGARLFVSATAWESARQLGMQRGEVPIKVSTRTNRS